MLEPPPGNAPGSAPLQGAASLYGSGGIILAEEEGDDPSPDLRSGPV